MAKDELELVDYYFGNKLLLTMYIYVIHLMQIY